MGGQAPAGPGLGRIEAFSDGIIAAVILITILELRLPEALDDVQLLDLLPVVFSYALSFVVLMVMWTNHHRLLHLAERATPALVWANALLLFCLSFVPFVTGMLSGGPLRPLAAALYGGVMACCAGAFLVLRLSVAAQGGGLARRALGRSVAGVVLYGASVPLSFLSPRIALAIFVAVPVLFTVAAARGPA